MTLKGNKKKRQAKPPKTDVIREEAERNTELQRRLRREFYERQAAKEGRVGDRRRDV